MNNVVNKVNCPPKKKPIHLLLTVRRIEKETNKKNRLDVSSVTCNCHPWFKKKNSLASSFIITLFILHDTWRLVGLISFEA